MKKYSFLVIILFTTFVNFFTETCFAGEYKPFSNPEKLEVSFTDPIWDGKSIPVTQRCGSPDASTPRLIVKNIPAGTNAIIMEYGDADWPDMDNGGHGMIGYQIAKGTTEITIPSLPANTFDLLDGFFLVAAHAGRHFKPGAYMSPCSGGMGNSYYVTVKAVHQASPESKQFKVLKQAVLELGKF